MNLRLPSSAASVSIPLVQKQAASPMPRRIGPYRIVGVLGRGGMAVVYDAVDKNQLPVALKIVSHIDSTQPRSVRDSLVARFEREAQILAELDHANIVKLFEAGEADGLLFLALEKVEGVSLLELRRRSALQLEPLIELGVSLCGALQHVHDQGVVHRDVKPGNVLIRASGHPVLTDFGISGFDRASAITRQGDLLGSPGFMAPEVISGATPTPAADQYALGRLLYELGAVGPSQRLPKGLPVLEVLSRSLDIDWTRFPSGPDWTQLRAILKTMLDHEPSNRFSGLQEVKEHLARLSAGALGPATLLAAIDGLPETTFSRADEDFERSQAVDPAEAPGDEFDLSYLEQPAGHRAEPRPLSLPPADTSPELVQQSEGRRPTTRDRQGFDASSPAVPKLKLPSVGGARRRSTSEDSAQAAEPEGGPGSVSISGLIDRPPTPHPDERAAPPAPEQEPIRPAPTPAVLRAPSAAPRSTPVEDLPRPARPSKRALAPILGLGALCGVGGILVGRASNPVPNPVVRVEVAILPDRTGRPPGPPLSTEASARDIRDARNLYEIAKEKLKSRNLAAAENMLSLCIEAAELADCYRLRGSLRALFSEAGAWEDLRRYLEVAHPSELTSILRDRMDNSD